MAQVIGSAAIRLTAEDAGLKEQINRDLNDAFKSVNINADPLTKLQQQLRAGELDLVKAQQAEVTAEGVLAKAEGNLKTLREARTVDTKAVTAAELALYRAELELATAHDKVTTAERSVNAIESTLTKTTRDLSRAKAEATAKASALENETSKLKKAWDSLDHPMKLVGSGFLSLGSGAVSLGKKIGSIPVKLATKLFDDFGNKVKNVGKSLGSATFAGLKQGLQQAALSPVTSLMAGFSGLQKLGTGAFSILGSKVSLFASGGAAALGPLFGLMLALPGIALAGGAAIGVLKLGADGLKASVKQLSPAFDQLKKSVSGVFQKQLTPVFATLVPVIRQLTGVLDGTATAVSGVIKQMIGVINTTPGINLLKTSLGGVNQFITALGPGLANLLTSFLALTTTIAPQMSVIGSAIGGIFTAIRSSISDLQASGGLDKIFANLPSLFSALGGIIRPVLTILGNLASVLIGPLSLALSGVGQLLLAAEPGLTAFGSAIGQALTALQPLLASLGPLVGQLASLLGSVLASAVKALAPPLTALMNGMSHILVPILPVLSKAFDSLAQALTPIANVLVKALLAVFQALAPMLPQIVTFIAQLAQMFGQLLSAVFPILPPLLQLASALFPILISVLQAAMPIISAVVAAINLILPVLLPLINFLAGAATKAIQAFLPVVQIVFTTIAKVITDVMGIIKGIIEVVLGLLTGNWRQAMDGIKSIVSNVWNLIKDIFTGAVSAVWGVVKAGFTTIKDFFGQLPGSILHVLGNLGSILLGAGKALIDGLINGITGAAKRLWDTVKGIGSKVGGFFKSVLGIGSPSKVFHQFGRWIMQGLGNGLVAGTAPVLATVGKVADQVMNAFAPGLSAPGAGSVSINTLAAPSTGPGVGGGTGGGPPSPKDYFDAVSAALTGWQVTLSATQAATEINRVNKKADLNR